MYCISFNCHKGIKSSDIFIHICEYIGTFFMTVYLIYIYIICNLIADKLRTFLLICYCKN